MSALRNVVLACFILLALSPLNDGLKCYDCNGCSDPFNSNGVKIEERPDNEGYYCTKRVVAFFVTRGIDQTCNSVNVLGSGEWCCQKDFCNGTTKLASTSFLFLMVIFAGFAKLF